MANPPRERHAALTEPPPPGAFTIIEVPAAHWHRVHRYDRKTGRFGPTQFNDTAEGNARFSPLVDPVTGEVISTLYAACGAAAAISEVVLRNVPVPSHGYLHDIRADTESDLHVSEISLPNLLLVNLTTTGMSAAGMPPYAFLDQDSAHYPETRKWALWIRKHHPKAQGLFWMSRRYSRESAIMLFEDRLASNEIKAIQSAPLSEYTQTIIAILAEMGAGVVPDF